MSHPAIAPDMWIPLDPDDGGVDKLPVTVSRGFWAGVRTRLFRHNPRWLDFALSSF